MSNTILLYMVLGLPFLSFLLFGLTGKSKFRFYAGHFASLLIFFTAAAAIQLSYRYFNLAGEDAGIAPLTISKFTWLKFFGAVTIDIGWTIDSITAMMIVVVTFISLMVHVFSISYMQGSERIATYFAYLGLFTFSMLGLVLASTLFQIYIFWELVGLSSFLLISYYYQKPAAIAAAKKAFIVTRFADLGFLIGILLLASHAGTLDIQTLVLRLTDPDINTTYNNTGLSFLGISALTWALSLIFMGAAGKSALFPLHIWLPDAMEGPTPVSALIHAATMVVAGVYLVAKLFPVYLFVTPEVLNIITWIGGLSAVLAAVLACVQTDIKRILAYSTMSQIGFMICALGANTPGLLLGYSASLFHLFTHAIFKALLFLCAGAIIHVLHTNEIAKMGGLRKSMPLIHIAFLIGCLSIAGIPPFAGFFSKEWILLAAHETNSILFWVLLITSGITTFYMFRLYFLVFWNRKSAPDTKSHSNLYESIPLILLTLGTISAGFLPFGQYVYSGIDLIKPEMHMSFAIYPILLSITGISLAGFLYLKERQAISAKSSDASFMMNILKQKFYIDQIYLFITHRIIFKIVGNITVWFDRYIVENISYQSGNAAVLLANKIKNLQSGKVQLYALWSLVGIFCLFLVFIYLRN